VLKSQAVAEKTAKKFRGPFFSAAPCRFKRLTWLIKLKQSVQNLLSEVFLNIIFLDVVTAFNHAR